MLAEVGLERGIGCDIRGVVEQQVELDLVGAGSSKVEVIEIAAIRRDPAQIGDAVGVLKQRRRRSEEAPKRGPVFLARIGQACTGLNASDRPST